uniref:VCBS domain-containing protein n=1 Tax=Shewanella sp. TaxID=50422 RepID=UPI004047ACDB
MTITIKGTNDAPVLTSTVASLAGAVTAAGIAADGSAVAGVLQATGTLAATDVDADATAVWTRTGTEASSYGTFVMGATGTWTYNLDGQNVQSLKQGQTVNETYAVQVSDGLGGVATQDVTITIKGTNDAPVLTGVPGSAVLLNENPTLGTVIADLGAADDDAGETFTYSLVNSPTVNSEPLFAIDSDGVITTTAAGRDAINYESADRSYTLTVRVTDSAGGTDEEDVTVNVNDVYDHAPIITVGDSAMDGMPDSVQNDASVLVTFRFAQPTVGFNLDQIGSTSGSFHGNWVAESLVKVSDTEWTARFMPEQGVAFESSDFYYRPVAQVESITLAGTPEIGDTYTLTVNNNHVLTHTVAYDATAGQVETLSDIAAALAVQADALGSVHASSSGAKITLTSQTAGIGFTVSAGASNHAVDETENATASNVTQGVDEVQAVTAVTAAPQVSTVTIPGTVAAGETVTLTIAGTPYEVTVAADETAADVASNLATAIGATISGVTVAASSAVVTLTGTAGDSFAVALADTLAGADAVLSTTPAVQAVAGVTAVTGVAQVDEVLLAGTPEIGDTYTVTVDGTPFAHTVGYNDTEARVETLADIATALSSQIDPLSSVTASATGAVITITAAQAGAAGFSLAASATDRPAVNDQAATVANEVPNSVVSDIATSTDGLQPGPKTAYSVDTVAPGSATVTLLNDTGDASDDGVTKYGTVDVSLDEGTSVWHYSTDGGTTWSAEQSAATTDFTLTAGSYADGAVQVKEIDPAGNETITNLGSVTIDQAGPTATVATAVSSTVADASRLVTYTVQFNEAVQELRASDIVVTGGAVALLPADVALTNVLQALDEQLKSNNDVSPLFPDDGGAALLAAINTLVNGTHADLGAAVDAAKNVLPTLSVEQASNVLSDLTATGANAVLSSAAVGEVMNLLYDVEPTDGVTNSWTVNVLAYDDSIANLSVKVEKANVYDIAGNQLLQADASSTGLAVDTVNPEVSSVTATPAQLGDAQTGSDKTLKLEIVFDEPMDQSQPPVLTLIPSVDQTLSLSQDNALSRWTNDTTYVATYTTQDAGVDEAIKVKVEGARDANGNNLVPFETSASVLQIDTLNPTVLTFTENNQDETVSDIDRDVTYSVTFSEAVQSLTSANIVVTNGSFQNFTQVSSTSATFVVRATDEVTGTLTVALKDVKDTQGNSLSQPPKIDLVLDTENPDVAFTSVGAAGIVSTTLAGGLLVKGTAEANDGPVTVKFGSDGYVLGTATVASDGKWELALDDADVVRIGYGGGKQVTATQTDAAGNETTVTSASFSSEVLESIAALQNEEATVVPVANSTTIDFSKLVGDISVDASGNSAGVIGGVGGDIDSGTSTGFDTFVTGAGNDRLFGSAIDETFATGTGYDVVDGGDGTDKLDLSRASGDSGKGISEQKAQPVDGPSKTLSLTGLTVTQGDVAILNIGGRNFAMQSSGTGAEMLTSLVAALSAQLSYAGSPTGLNLTDLSGLALSSVEESLTLTGAPAGAEFGLSILSVSGAIVSLANDSIVVGNPYLPQDPSQYNPDSPLLQNTVAGVAVTQGGWVEVTNIEDLLGTAYSDILGGSDVANVIDGGAGDDFIDGAGGDDVLIGGAGSNILYGGESSGQLRDVSGKVVLDEIYYNGSGRDTFVISLGATNSIRDFDISGLLTSDSGRVDAHTLDRIQFKFTQEELTQALGGVLPSNLDYTLEFTDISSTIGDGRVHWALTLKVDDVPVSTVNFDWDSDPLAGLGANFSIEHIDLSTGTIAFDANGDAFVYAALELVNNATVDTSSAEVIVGARTGDVLVMTDADNTLVGGVGSDRYEARILGSVGNLGTQTINDLGRARGGLEEDSVLVEGARDLGDLTFSRAKIAAEGDDRSLAIGVEQYRGDNSMFGFGTVEVFNQFSLTQSNVYKVEKLQIGAEFSDPLEALVKTYYFGDVVGTTASGGDVIEAQADRDSIMVGHKDGTKVDEFIVDVPTEASAQQEVVADGTTFDVARDDQDVWIYGMDGNEMLTLSGSKDGWVLTGDAENKFEQVTLANGSSAFKAVATKGGGTPQTNDDIVLNLFFADGGNVDSSSLLANRIKWE